MEKYAGTKIVEAEPMTRGDYHTYRGWTIPENENPDDEGYLVKYNDNYISWSPKDTFEASYSNITNGIPAGVAFSLMKQGKLVTREGWFGGRYLTLVKGGTHPNFGSQDAIGLVRFPGDEPLPGWLANQIDLIADDYTLYQEEE